MEANATLEKLIEKGRNFTHNQRGILLAALIVESIFTFSVMTVFAYTKDTAAMRLCAVAGFSLIGLTVSVILYMAIFRHRNFDGPDDFNSPNKYTSGTIAEYARMQYLERTTEEIKLNDDPQREKSSRKTDKERVYDKSIQMHLTYDDLEDISLNSASIEAKPNGSIYLKFSNDVLHTKSFYINNKSLTKESQSKQICALHIQEEMIKTRNYNLISNQKKIDFIFLNWHSNN